MRRRCAFLFAIALSASLALVAVAGQSSGQPEKKPPLPPETQKGPAKAGEIFQVEIVTVDRVELKGKYYSAGKADAPCVLMLHALRDSSSNKEWNHLARKLNEKGYAVLMFDFRGHGDSTKVQPGAPADAKNRVPVRGFWDESLNQQNVKGLAANKPRPTSIQHEQFSANYWTVLCNDIAAAKVFLDERPDCNSSNLILIGAEDGATLGALWLNSEFRRYTAPQQGRPIDRAHPEGLAITSAVWLTISPKLGTSKAPISVPKTLEIAGGNYFKVPMMFAYGEGDSAGQDQAKNCEKLLTAKDKKVASPKAVKIEGAEKMAGKKLLLESLPTVDRTIKFLNESVPAKAIQKGMKITDGLFIWEWPDASGRAQQAVANDKGSNRLKFASYASFVMK